MKRIRLTEGTLKKMTRKPWSWDDVNQVQSYEIPESDTIVIGKLPTFGVRDIYDNSNVKPCDNFSETKNPKSEQFFLLVRGGKTYLINTEGYDYARYALEIKI